MNHLTKVLGLAIIFSTNVEAGKVKENLIPIRCGSDLSQDFKTNLNHCYMMMAASFISFSELDNGFASG
jgi:hypothetical protein